MFSALYPRTAPQDKIRLEMKGRYNVVNKAAEERRSQRRDAGEPAVVEESGRRVKPEDEGDDVYEQGYLDFTKSED